MRDEDDDIEDDGDDAPAPAAKPTKPVLPRLVKPGDAAPSAPLGGTQLARVVRPSAEQEVVEMLAEQTRFASDPETRAVACQLLASGYTVRDVSRRLKLRPHIVWQWAEDPGIKASIDKGRELRRRSLGQELEDAAEAALSTLVDLMNDDAVTPKDRLKAAELVLDRCGLVEVATKASTTTETVVKVDVDFDERLARIVAGQRTSG